MKMIQWQLGRGWQAWVFGLLLGGAAQAQTNFTLLKSFTSVPEANVSYGGLVMDTNGLMYGATVSGGTFTNGAVYVIQTNAYGYRTNYGFRTLYSFAGSNGSAPYGKLAIGTNGMLFGTTRGGGISNAGTIYGVTKDGRQEVLLHQFLGGAGWHESRGRIIAGQ